MKTYINQEFINEHKNEEGFVVFIWNVNDTLEYKGWWGTYKEAKKEYNKYRLSSANYGAKEIWFESLEDDGDNILVEQEDCCEEFRMFNQLVGEMFPC